MKLLANKNNVNAADSDYPFGNVRDKTATVPGTIWNREMMGDVIQFFEKMFDESGLTANGLPDNEYSGWQLYDAFRKLTKPYKSYVANMEQMGTAAPTANVMVNEFPSAIVWTRSATGQYIGTLAGAFSLTKTAVFASNNCFANQDNRVYVVVASTDTIFLQTRDSAGAAGDGLLARVSIDIRTYD